MSYGAFSAMLGSALAITILILVRRDHLQLGHALFWIAFAAASLVFGLIPGMSDALASALGISYGPILVVLIAVSALILRLLQADIHATRLERSVRRLTQRLTMLEADMADLRTEAGDAGGSENTRRSDSKPARHDAGATSGRDRIAARS